MVGAMASGRTIGQKLKHGAVARCAFGQRLLSDRRSWSYGSWRMGSVCRSGSIDVVTRVALYQVVVIRYRIDSMNNCRIPFEGDIDRTVAVSKVQVTMNRVLTARRAVPSGPLASSLAGPSGSMFSSVLDIK